MRPAGALSAARSTLSAAYVCALVTVVLAFENPVG
jgi:hypothetical protein